MEWILNNSPIITLVGIIATLVLSIIQSIDSESFKRKTKYKASLVILFSITALSAVVTFVAGKVNDEKLNSNIDTIKREFRYSTIKVDSLYSVVSASNNDDKLNSIDSSHKIPRQTINNYGENSHVINGDINIDTKRLTKEQVSELDASIKTMKRVLHLTTNKVLIYALVNSNMRSIMPQLKKELNAIGYEAYIIEGSVYGGDPYEGDPCANTPTCIEYDKLTDCITITMQYM